MVGVGYNGDDAKSKTEVTDVESCKRFCTEDPATPYFGWWESKAGCWCKTKEDPARRVELTGGYVSGPVSCVALCQSKCKKPCCDPPTVPNSVRAEFVDEDSKTVRCV